MTKKKVQDEFDVADGTTIHDLLMAYGPTATVHIDGWDDRIYVLRERLETDEEEEARERKAERARLAAAARKAKADEKDRALYEQLKKRFENDNA